MSKIMMETERPRTIWHMRIWCCTSKTKRAKNTRPNVRKLAHVLAHARSRLRTHTHTYNNYCFSTSTMVPWIRLNVTLYVNCLSCACFHDGSVVIFCWNVTHKNSNMYYQHLYVFKYCTVQFIFKSYFSYGLRVGYNLVYLYRHVTAFQ